MIKINKREIDKNQKDKLTWKFEIISLFFSKLMYNKINKKIIPNSIKVTNYISGFKKNLKLEINNNLRLKNISS